MLSNWKVIYFTTFAGENPVEKFIDSLQKHQKAKIFRIFQYIELYGLISILPHVKKLTGTSLWEIRIVGQDNIRILYITLQERAVLVVHGFIKKKQKTPTKEVKIAMRRVQEWLKKTSNS